MKTSGIHCPLCRGHIKRKERFKPTRALDREAEMHKHHGRCKYCERQVRSSQPSSWASSTEGTFPTLQPKPGRTTLPSISVAGPELGTGCRLKQSLGLAECNQPDSCQVSATSASSKVKYHYMRRHYRTCSRYQEEYGLVKVKDNLISHKDSAGNRQSTYVFPIYLEADFDRRGLLDHDFHIVSVFCPICISLPQGDPNQKFADIVGHLNARHQFNHEDFMKLILAHNLNFKVQVGKAPCAHLTSSEGHSIVFKQAICSRASRPSSRPIPQRDS
ncbi:E3 ubiquitin- ligase RNF138 isoform X1 [Pelobates cultripes]|uniref:E3 ubiquitin- ligase RNF138 isoform X1 n=1 Tax=Pelobates cultripes TaxID=61616 RepID=A0AAD1S0A7_PELCU|nr:E3 ubiquitin- ligase RNF138 isoform X1 [Pelobates cultripes]